jgi:aminodeoxyfutalosine synthase
MPGRGGRSVPRDIEKLRLRDRRLEQVAEKVLAEQRLDREDGILVATSDDLLGVGRLDNIPHIKAYWIMLGEKLAQVAQSFGADDLDGTIIDERITYAAGGTAGKGISRAGLERLIREAGREPVLRDTLYRVIDSSMDSSIADAASAAAS